MTLQLNADSAQVLSLGTGQGLLFAPGCLCVKTHERGDSLARPSPLGRGYLVIRSRLRVTQDGGHSLLAVTNSAHATRLPRVRQAVTQDTSRQTLPIIVSSSTSGPSRLAPETHAETAPVGGDVLPQYPSSRSASSTSAYLPIVRIVAKVHENGYSSVSLGHLVLKLVSKQGKKPFRIYGELEAAIALGVSDGELVEIEQGGNWFMLQRFRDIARLTRKVGYYVLLLDNLENGIDWSNTSRRQIVLYCRLVHASTFAR